MSSLLFLLAACSNVAPPSWSGGGARYASGDAFTIDEDTGGDTGEDSGGDDTGNEGDENGAYLQSGTAIYQMNEAEEVYVVAGIAYEDDPDDVDGGTLYYSLYESGELSEQSSRDVVAGTSFDKGEEAGVVDGVITFQVGPVQAEVAHVLEVYVVDYTRNRSNTIEIEVTAR